MDRIVTDLSAFAQLIKLDALHVVELEALASDGMAAKEIAWNSVGHRRIIERRGNSIAARNDPDAATQQPDRRANLDSVGLELGVQVQAGGNFVQVVSMPNMRILNRRRYRYRFAGRSRISGQCQHLSVSGHVVSAGKHDLIAHLPGGNWPIQGEGLFGASACQVCIQARPAGTGTRRVAAHGRIVFAFRRIAIRGSVVCSAFRAEQLQRTAEGNPQILVSKVCVGISAVVIQRLVLVKAIVDAAVGATPRQIICGALNIRLYDRVRIPDPLRNTTFISFLAGYAHALGLVRVLGSVKVNGQCVSAATERFYGIVASQRSWFGAVVRSPGSQSPAVFHQDRVGPKVDRGVLESQGASLRHRVGFRPHFRGVDIHVAVVVAARRHLTWSCHLQIERSAQRGHGHRCKRPARARIESVGDRRPKPDERGIRRKALRKRCRNQKRDRGDLKYSNQSAHVSFLSSELDHSYPRLGRKLTLNDAQPTQLYGICNTVQIDNRENSC